MIPFNYTTVNRTITCEIQVMWLLAYSKYDIIIEIMMIWKYHIIINYNYYQYLWDPSHVTTYIRSKRKYLAYVQEIWHMKLNTYDNCYDMKIPHDYNYNKFVLLLSISVGSKSCDYKV